MDLFSGAGHDAQMFARICPTSMIFVPSKDGLSHNPAEYTSQEQIMDGANVLLQLLLQSIKIPLSGDKVLITAFLF